MRELNRYDFSNDKSFVTHLLNVKDQQRIGAPECDVIGLRRWIGDDEYMLVMRPDEALILARLLVDAVWQVTEGYSIGGVKLSAPTDAIAELAQESLRVADGVQAEINRDSSSVSGFESTLIVQLRTLARHCLGHTGNHVWRVFESRNGERKEALRMPTVSDEEQVFKISEVEKHAACCHAWKIRDDGSLLCQRCNITQLPAMRQ